MQGPYVRYATCQTGAYKLKSLGSVAVVTGVGNEVDVLHCRQKISLSAEWLICAAPACGILMG